MKYKIHNGVIQVEICGETFLVSTCEARDKCPYFTALNESSSFIWKLIEEEKNTDEMCSEIQREYDISESEAGQSLQMFLNDLERQHFITKEAD